MAIFPNTKVLKIASLFAASASLVLYVLSLALPCFSPGNDPGIGLLIFGAIGVLCGEFPWLANPCFVVGLLCLFLSSSKSFSIRKALACCRIAMIVSPMGAVFALMFLFQSNTLL